MSVSPLLMRRDPSPWVLWSLPKSMWIMLFVISYIMVSLAIFCRLWRDVHPRWFSRLVTLVVRLYRFSTKHADLRCTFSIFVICPSVCGSQTVHAYSKTGRTIAIYMLSLCLSLMLIFDSFAENLEFCWLWLWCCEHGGPNLDLVQSWPPGTLPR